VAQTISYEVSIALVLIRVFCLTDGLAIKSLISLRRVSLVGVLLPALVMWLAVGLAETNRTPFDFSEGERELVSGFNIEYGSGGFALIFMAEYASILLMGGLSAFFILGGSPLELEFRLITVSLASLWV